MTRLLLLQIIAGVTGGFLASKKGRSFLLWFLLCFMLPAFLIAVVLLPPGRKTASKRRCPSCSGVMMPREQFCSRCRRKDEVELIHCRSCGQFIPAGEECQSCKKE